MLSGVYRVPQMESVVFGKPYAEALAQEVDRLDARAVFVLASGTLASTTDAVERLRRVLGNRIAGICAKIGAHTPRIDVVAAANAARETGADLLVTLGGGSVTDAAKMVGLCLGNGVTEPDQLDNFRATIAADGTARRPPRGFPSTGKAPPPRVMYHSGGGRTRHLDACASPAGGANRGRAVGVERVRGLGRCHLADRAGCCPLKQLGLPVPLPERLDALGLVVAE